MGYNSTIKQKTGFCIDCDDGIKKPLVAGRCQYHYSKHRSEVCEKRRKERMTPTDALEKTFAISSPQSALVLWYADKMKISEPICENCGQPINKFNQKWWHGSQAHILPKSDFPSVATHKHNHMILSMYNCSCHGQFDSSWMKAQEMPIFSTAKQRFKLFEKDIAPEERRKIPACFLND